MNIRLEFYYIHNNDWHVFVGPFSIADTQNVTHQNA